MVSFSQSCSIQNLSECECVNGLGQIGGKGMQQPCFKSLKSSSLNCEGIGGR